ncbi:MAG: hypothetical protein EON94_05795, partial [Caulobacteraceae bacterium]
MAGPDYFFCVAHEVPWYELPPHVEIVATGAFQAHGRLNIRDSRKTFHDGSLNIDSYYPYLTGTAGSLYVSELLQERETTGKSVCIFQYRKVISPSPIGTQAQNFPYMRILSPPVAPTQIADLLAACTTDTLVSQNLQPSYQDEWTVGLQHRIGDWDF